MDSLKTIFDDGTINYTFWNEGTHDERKFFCAELRMHILVVYTWETAPGAPRREPRKGWSYITCDRNIILQFSSCGLEFDPHIAMMNAAMACGLESWWVRDFILEDK